MRRLTALVAALGFVFVVTALVQSSASAGTTCEEVDPNTGECLIWVKSPEDPNPPGTPGDDRPRDTGTGDSCYWDGRRQNIHRPPPGPVPCTSEAYGYWSNAYNCYIKEVVPRPGPSDDYWGGNYREDGSVYFCFQPQTHILLLIWAADPPPNSGSGPTPREVAEIAITRMQLKAIAIGMAPEPVEGSIGIVGMPVWMWAAEPDASTVGPVTATASAGGISITATARLHRITWGMGDGTQVQCSGPGTAYRASYGHRNSPTCGHTYTTTSAGEPDMKYTVSATSEWVVEWEGAGQSGTIRLDGLTRSARVAIGELQVLVQ